MNAMPHVSLAGLLFFPGGDTGVPDIAPNPVHRSGLTLSPREATRVAMRAETVDILLHADHADIKAVFTMVNTSDRVEQLEVGFPTAAKPRKAAIGAGPVESVNPFEYVGSIYGFEAKVDGKVVEFERKSLPREVKAEHRQWVCWPMEFAAAQTIEVEVRYQVETHDATYLRPFNPLQPREVHYVLKTGRGWHGPIGSAKIRVELDEALPAEVIEAAAPDGVKRKGRRCEWLLADFEPEQDVRVRYRVYADAETAVVGLRKVIKEDPKHPGHRLDLAENLESLGRHAEAAAAYAAIDEMCGANLRRLPKFMTIRLDWVPLSYHAARCYRAAKEPDKAKLWGAKATKYLRARINRYGDRDNERVRALQRLLDELESWRKN